MFEQAIAESILSVDVDMLGDIGIYRYNRRFAVFRAFKQPLRGRKDAAAVPSQMRQFPLPKAFSKKHFLDLRH